MRFMGDLDPGALQMELYRAPWDLQQQLYVVAAASPGGKALHDGELSHEKKQGVILGALGGLVAGFVLFRKKKR